MLLVASKYTWLLEDGIFHHFVFVALRTQVCWQLFIAYVPIQSFVIWKELHHIYLYGDKGHFSWCLVTKLLCLYFKFLLVQQKLFVKNRYCILQLMQWSSHLHPHGKRQCYLWVIYGFCTKLSLMTRQQRTGFPEVFLNVAIKSKSLLTIRKFQSIFLRQELLFWFCFTTDHQEREHM